MRAALTVLALLGAGCGDPGCLEGSDPSCAVPSPCQELAFSCDGGEVRAQILTSLDELPVGNQSLASPGDVLLANDKVWVVIDALDHPHLLADTGGTIIDMGTWDGGEDAMQQVFQVSGLLPTEVAHYTDLRLIDEGDVQGVQFTGHLAGNEDLFIATRYEIRPCEQGVRVRTEMVNRSPEPQSWMLLDAFWWGGRGLLSFAPQEDGGFTWPEWDLLTIAEGFASAPYMAGGLHDGSATSFATTSCSADAVDALHSEYVSGAGLGPRVVQPRDYLVYERFIAAGRGPSVSAATDPILEVRRQLFDEAYIELSGTLSRDGEAIEGGVLAASVQIDADGIPVTQLVPEADGSFRARVPAGKELSLTVTSFGRVTAEQTVAASSADVALDPIDLPPIGGLTLDATVDGSDALVLAFVLPADDATREAVAGDAFGHWGTCAPLLGLPHGSSPACNRVLVDGSTTFPILPGTYDVFATTGPFSTLAAARGVQVLEGQGAQATLALQSLDLQPANTLSADFHVHGGASWDATIEDLDRVRAFLAADIDVIVSTEHNVAWNYADAIDQLGADSEIQLINGTETTGVLLFDVVPDTLIPKVTGHWNLWPMPFDAEGPYRGAFWDQQAMPGELFNRASQAGWPASTGIAQLNHPTSALLVGRDFGWADTIELDLNRDVVEAYDGTPHSLFADQPAGTPFRNSDFHTTEVMNGTANEAFEGYRSIWWWMLDQGLPRAGTANSDSHTLTENVVGTPRTLVWTDQQVGVGFDTAAFNAAVRDGRMVGTNGPILTAELLGDAAVLTPSLTPFSPASDAELHITVHAAPWVPVDEVRIIVNGEVVETLTDLPAVTDPLATDAALERLDVTLSIADWLPESGDAWLLVEAGSALPLSADLDCDGIPETGDANGDGTVDWRDVEALDEAPEDPCYDEVGDRPAYPAPEPGSPLWFFQTTVPGGYPASYTNPFLFDLDGNGFSGVSR